MFIACKTAEAVMRFRVASRAGRNANARVVEPRQNRFAVEVFKGNV
jgi:hypothetical protein